MQDSTYRFISVIYNPLAGKLRRRAGLLSRTVEILKATGAEVRLEPTAGPGDAGAIAARCIRQSSDLILVAGGDGTVNEALQGMVGAGVPLGVLPAGTANVLAMELGLGSKMKRVAAMLPGLVPRQISLGRLRAVGCEDGRYFLAMTGAGLDADIVRVLNLRLKTATGKFAYWVAGLSKLASLLGRLHVDVNGQRVTAGFALVSRVRNYGGNLEIAHSVRLTDNDFEVVLFEGRVPLRYGLYFLGVITRLEKFLPGISVMRSRRVELLPADGRDIFLQVDGELAGKLPATLEIVPGGLTLLMPPGYPHG